VIFLLSGGGSALLPFPVNGIELKEKQEATQLLLDCGADIKEINTIRKHISRVKGGWLAKWAYPSTVIGFILSDVVGDPLDAIGSGPTVPDPSTFDEAWEVLRKYDLLNRIAPSIKNFLELGKEGKVEESPKMGDIVFQKVYNSLIGSNILALRAAEKKATSLVSTLSSSLLPLKGRHEKQPGFILPCERSNFEWEPNPKTSLHPFWRGDDSDDQGSRSRREKPGICFGRGFRDQRDRKGGPPERRDGWNRWTHGRFRRSG